MTMYMACAFGMAACMNNYKVRYIRLPDLLIELHEAERNNTLPKALKRYINPRLLIVYLMTVRLGP